MKKRVREEEKKEENGFEIVNWKFVHGLYVRPNITCATSGCLCSKCATYEHLCLHVHLNRSCMLYIDESYYVLEWKIFFLIMLVWKIIWPIMLMWKNNSSILIINLCYHYIWQLFFLNTKKIFLIKSTWEN
jgi:hypothetical protein